MVLACKATLDDDHGRTRIDWRIPSHAASATPAAVEAPVLDAIRDQPLAARPEQAAKSGFDAQASSYDLTALDDLPPVRAARVMLRSAAEIEHQLFLQYLYASSSLKDPLAAGMVTDIAVEEMGHLLTVNNVLIAMDGDPYFGRGPDESQGPTNDPFAFKLRAASQMTLAMFTAAESPDPKALGSWWARYELRRIFDTADAPLQFHPVQRVGKLYDKIVTLLRDDRVTDAEFAHAAQYLPIQASSTEAWSHAGVSRHMIVERITSREEAVQALVKIMTQGEGFLNGSDSHFERFRRLYRGMCLPRLLPRAFPALLPPAGASQTWIHGLWRTLGFYSPNFDALEPAQSTAAPPTPTTQLLARLLNTRYQLLLIRLYQIFAPNPVDAKNIRIDCALREMRFVLASLTDCIRQSVEGGACPGLYTLPPFFDPHTCDERQALQKSLSRDTQELLDQLDAAGPMTSALQSIAAAIQDLDRVLAVLPRVRNE